MHKLVYHGWLSHTSYILLMLDSEANIGYYAIHVLHTSPFDLCLLYFPNRCFINPGLLLGSLYLPVCFGRTNHPASRTAICTRSVTHRGEQDSSALLKIPYLDLSYLSSICFY
jgi:hypothetical protein